MKTWQKVTLGGFVVVVIGAAYLAFFLPRHVRAMVADLYAQWASADMVIAFRKEKNRMPSAWDELAPFYERDSPHCGGLGFEDIQSRMVIDFAELPKLELEYTNKDVPEIIRTASGSQSHWEGAEPNQLVNREVRK